MSFETVHVHENDVKPAYLTHKECVFESTLHAGLEFNEKKCYCRDEYLNLLLQWWIDTLSFSSLCTCDILFYPI